MKAVTCLQTRNILLRRTNSANDPKNTYHAYHFQPLVPSCMVWKTTKLRWEKKIPNWLRSSELLLKRMRILFFLRRGVFFCSSPGTKGVRRRGSLSHDVRPSQRLFSFDPLPLPPLACNHAVKRKERTQKSEGERKRGNTLREERRKMFL